MGSRCKAAFCVCTDKIGGEGKYGAAFFNWQLGRDLIEGKAEESWSRSVLIDNIKAHLYQSSGNALTNFTEKLPTIQGKLAQEIIKDTYDFGFVSLPAGYDEKELEDAIQKRLEQTEEEYPLKLQEKYDL